MTARNHTPRHRTALTTRDLSVVAQVFGFTSMDEFGAFLERQSSCFLGGQPEVRIPVQEANA